MSEKIQVTNAMQENLNRITDIACKFGLTARDISVSSGVSLSKINLVLFGKCHGQIEKSIYDALCQFAEAFGVTLAGQEVDQSARDFLTPEQEREFREQARRLGELRDYPLRSACRKLWCLMDDGDLLKRFWIGPCEVRDWAANRGSRPMVGHLETMTRLVEIAFPEAGHESV